MRMHVISQKRIRRAAMKFPPAATELMDWLRTTRRARWSLIIDVRKAHPAADGGVMVASGNLVTVFNVRGNHFRLITAIKYRYQRVYVLAFLTHAEYSKNSWKDRL
jgi:mRNA interferase HigB